MKQVIIQSNKLIKELAGSDIEIYAPTLDGEDIQMTCGKLFHLKIPFNVKVLSGGRLDLDFKLSHTLAKNGVSLIGAYWDQQEINAYFMPLEGIDVTIGANVPVLTGTLMQVVSYRQVELDLLDGVVDLNKSGDALSVDLSPAVPKKGKKKK
jgi:hypothetical protein